MKQTFMTKKAQLVEQRTENPFVPGSIPGGTAKQSESIELPLDRLRAKSDRLHSVFLSTTFILDILLGSPFITPIL